MIAAEFETNLEMYMQVIKHLYTVNIRIVKT